MATKTFKIGEYAKGGVITVHTTTKTVTVIGKDWDFSQGSNKSSDQSNAKPFTEQKFTQREYRKMMDFLCDLTTSYYAEQIAAWVETKLKFDRGMFGS